MNSFQNNNYVFFIVIEFPSLSSSPPSPTHMLFLCFSSMKPNLLRNPTSVMSLFCASMSSEIREALKQHWAGIHSLGLFFSPFKDMGRSWLPALGHTNISLEKTRKSAHILSWRQLSVCENFLTSGATYRSEIVDLCSVVLHVWLLKLIRS